MYILEWAKANRIHIRVTDEQISVFAYGEDAWPVSDLHTVCLLSRVKLPSADESQIIECSGKTRALAFVALCATISGGKVWHNEAWLEIPQLTYWPPN